MYAAYSATVTSGWPARNSSSKASIQITDAGRSCVLDGLLGLDAQVQVGVGLGEDRQDLVVVDDAGPDRPVLVVEAAAAVRQHAVLAVRLPGVGRDPAGRPDRVLQPLQHVAGVEDDPGHVRARPPRRSGPARRR